MQSSREVAVGLFPDPQQAGDAINALNKAGFSADDISLLVPDSEPASSHWRTEGESRGTKGLVAGAVLGGLGGWLAGIRALPIPTVGPFIAAGSVALGAGVGTIAGAVLGIGVSNNRHTLVLVRAADRLDEANRILRDHGAARVEHVREVSPSVVSGGVH
jgi:hypothetical protein